MYLLGIDVGRSFVEVSLVESATGNVLASSKSPETEMPISIPDLGYAEQDPATWWESVLQAQNLIREQKKFKPEEVSAIGIAYQMDGLVIVDEAGEVLRPAIIGSDQRASEIGEKYCDILGKENCMSHLLNSPGSYSASKLKWVQEYEPEIYARVSKMMLVGDYIAFKMSGKISTTITGLSEAVLWDFESTGMSDTLLDEMGIEHSLIPEVKETFDRHVELSAEVAEQMGLAAGTPITYKAGDQANNALALNVMEPGELAASAGATGVVYGVTENHVYDEKARVNIFAHVNHQVDRHRLGVLLSLRGCGNLYRHLRGTLKHESYEKMNELGSTIAVGSEGLKIYPFGNGAERLLENKNLGAIFNGLQFDKHDDAHLIRACHEGVAFAMKYGIDVMGEINAKATTVRASYAGLFLSPLFQEIFVNVTNMNLELYETSGSKGAALGAGIGAEIYLNVEDALSHITKVGEVAPNEDVVEQYREAYAEWFADLPVDKPVEEEDEF